MSKSIPDYRVEWKKNDEIVLQIDDMGTDAEGIAHEKGYTFFVKGALPGERVKTRIIKLKKKFGYARLMEILEFSPDRVTPLCNSASSCGGCTLQHLSYEGQLRYKEKKVKDCLIRIGGVEASKAEWLPILEMKGEPWNYRNKAQFPVRADREGNPVTGFFAGRTHHLVETGHCAIQHPIINDVTDIIMNFLRTYHISAYEEEGHKGLVRHIYVRRGYYTGQIMVCLVLNGTSLPHADALILRLKELEGMTGIFLNYNREKTNVIMGPTTKLLWGLPYIEDMICDIRYRISPQSFYQVNPVQTERLYKTVLEFAELRGNETVWDLYCGTGTISLFLAGSLKKGRVIGVEIVPEAIENAKINAANNQIQNAVFYTGAAEDVVADMVQKQVADGREVSSLADVVVVDPPRKGCDAKLLSTIAQMAPDRVVYVSCDPATLARDVKILGEIGYEVRRVRACDMFPQSGHVETIVGLQRQDM